MKFRIEFSERGWLLSKQVSRFAYRFNDEDSYYHHWEPLCTYETKEKAKEAAKFYAESPEEFEL